MSDETPLSTILEPADFYGGDSQHNLLACPACIQEWTHLERTVVYQRAEDEDTLMLSIPSDRGCGKVEQGENPSPRRDAVVLHFKGECGHLFTVTFIQHKGNTYAWATTVSKTA